MEPRKYEDRDEIEFVCRGLLRLFDLGLVDHDPATRLASQRMVEFSLGYRGERLDHALAYGSGRNSLRPTLLKIRREQVLSDLAEFEEIKGCNHLETASNIHRAWLKYLRQKNTRKHNPQGMAGHSVDALIARLDGVCKAVLSPGWMAEIIEKERK